MLKFFNSFTSNSGVVQHTRVGLPEKQGGDVAYWLSFLMSIEGFFTKIIFVHTVPCHPEEQLRAG